MISRFAPIIFLVLTALAVGCSQPESVPPSKPRVVVSIAPYRPFIQRLMDGEVDVDLLVPAGSSAHSYEPSARQVGVVASANLWFRIGEEFEAPTLAAIEGHSEKLTVIDLREGVDLLGDPSDPDPHIWLSPRQLKTQIVAIAKVLASHFPERVETIETQRDLLVEELSTLDLRIMTILDAAPAEAILVAHPAYLYFCNDYGIEQLSIERHGSEPGAHEVTDLLRDARLKRLHRVYVQPQHSSKGAIQLARALDAEVVEIDPFSEDYFNNMRTIAWKFAGY